MLDNFQCFCCPLLTFFKLTFKKKYFRSTITLTVSNGLNRDQDRHSVYPDLVPSCMQKLSADDKKWSLARKELNMYDFNLKTRSVGLFGASLERRVKVTKS